VGRCELILRSPHTIDPLKGISVDREFMRLAYFVTPHGFGHATRSAAIMAELQRREPTLSFEIFTTVPSSLFEQSGVRNSHYTPLQCDVGLIQRSSTEEDLPATITALQNLLPYRPALIDTVLSRLKQSPVVGCICDIAPLGILIAEQLAVPSVVVQNFTWPWIYAGYAKEAPGLQSSIDYLAGLYRRATHTIAATPSCLSPSEQAPRTVTVPLIGRRARKTPAETRAQLGLPEQIPIVLVSMGGIPGQFKFLPELHNLPSIHFLIGTPVDKLTTDRNVTCFPTQSDLYHPDLVQASELVISKLGYSTVAETTLAGTRLGAVERPAFPEHDVLSEFVSENLSSTPIAEREFWSGAWINRITEMLAMPKVPASAKRPDGVPLPRAQEADGAATAAELISRWLSQN
jgi:hypothetical protein